MVAKRALIVDDSKSARVVLSRMLQKYGIDADAVECAEAAIDYLTQHRPDVIFMDHLMPGMDGLQAVQAIKSNPQTATIPIMMYTSQQGEVYVGQARALGAVGVLPKLVKPVDVSKVLYQLNLLPDRRTETSSAFMPANEPAAAEAASDQSKAIAGLIPADWHPQLESALRNHDAELRRFVVASLDSFAGRIAGDTRNFIAETPVLQAPFPEERKPPYLWIAAIAAALIPGILLGVFYLRALENNRLLTADNVRLQQGNEQLSLAVERLAQRPEPARGSMTEIPALSMDNVSLAAGETVLAPLVEAVPYGEVPLALGRVDVLRELLARLEAQSFRGQVRAEYFVGEFCLTGNASEGYALAPPELPARRCDLIGNPYDDALGPAQHQSLAFANLASSVRRRTAEALTVEVAAGGERLKMPYPRQAENVTAGQWNEIAAQNSRVEFSAIVQSPAAP